MVIRLRPEKSIARVCQPKASNVCLLNLWALVRQKEIEQVETSHSFVCSIILHRISRALKYLGKSDLQVSREGKAA